MKSGYCSSPDCRYKGKEILLANQKYKLCYICNQERTGRPKKKPVKKIRKASGERDMNMKIWEEREHVCTNCGTWLGDDPCAQFFAHIVRKSKGEQYRLNPDNIRLLCLACHMALDQGTREQFNARTRS